MQHLLFFSVCITISYAAAAAADFLQNPDFEIPPLNSSSANSTSQTWVAKSIPGWSVNGTVWYVSSFPDNGGHALQLGLNGKINQTFTADGDNDNVLHYVLSFTVAAHNIECANNRTALNVTLRDSYHTNVSRVIYLQQNSSRNLWERHALFLGQLGGKDYVRIEIESVATNSQDNTTACWPIVDAFAVKRNVLPRWYDGNQLSNGGFEVGPAFLKNSGDGIILNEEEDMFDSPLQQWSILGSIRYIDSRHYKVPRGEAAVELLSGDPSGVSKDFTNLPTTYSYTLNFTLGDANDSCVADFLLYVQVGSSVYNFTMKSNGTGSAFKHTLKFRVEPFISQTSIAFYSFNETRTRDGVLCGPVLDDIFFYWFVWREGQSVQQCFGFQLVLCFCDDESIVGFVACMHVWISCFHKLIYVSSHQK